MYETMNRRNTQYGYVSTSSGMGVVLTKIYESCVFLHINKHHMTDIIMTTIINTINTKIIREHITANKYISSNVGILFYFYKIVLFLL